MNKRDKLDLLKLHNEKQQNKKKEWETSHNRAITRRDFMAAGIIPFSAQMFMPSWMKVFAQAGDARAAEVICAAGAASNMCPFISIKLSGGMAMSANFVPMNKDKQLLQSYSLMGMGSSSSLGLTYEFANNAPFYSASQLIAGIRANALPETLRKANFAGVCVRSQDDSSGNKFDITGLVIKSGLKGLILPNLGSTNSETGVNNTYAQLKPPAPLVVGSYESIANSLGVSGSLRDLTAAQKESLFKSVQNITADQARNIAGLTGGEVLGRIIQCANNDNTKLIQSNGNLNTNPLDNQAFATVWGINNNTNRSSRDFVFASLVYNALNGNASTVNLEMGGYDYHNGTRTRGDDADMDAGVVIGRVLQSMAVIGKKGFVVVTSDGSVTSPQSEIGGGPWTSDRGAAGCAYMIAFDPAGAHEAKSFQLGHFTNGQAADDTFLTGGSAELAASAMFVNYLSFNGMISQIESYLPRVFETHQIDLVKIFA